MKAIRAMPLRVRSTEELGGTCASRKAELSLILFETGGIANFDDSVLESYMPIWVKLAISVNL